METHPMTAASPQPPSPGIRDHASVTAPDPLRSDDRAVLVGYLHVHSRTPDVTHVQLGLAISDYADRHQFQLQQIVVATEDNELVALADLAALLRSTRIDAVLIAGPSRHALTMLDRFEPTVATLTLADVPPHLSPNES
jgi:hypothetical protein